MNSLAKRTLVSAVSASLALGITSAAPASVAKTQPSAVPAIRIKGMTFSAPVLQVKAGTTITWTNSDQVPHNIVAKDGSFRSKFLSMGDSFSFKFAKKGEFAYYCAIHPQMVAKIIVT